MISRMCPTRPRRIVRRTVMVLAVCVLLVSGYLASAPFVVFGISKLPVSGATTALARISNAVYGGPIGWYTADHDRPGVRAYINYTWWCVRLLDEDIAPPPDQQLNAQPSGRSVRPQVRVPNR